MGFQRHQAEKISGNFGARSGGGVSLPARDADKPRDDGQHSDPSEHANGRAYLYVVLEHARLRKKVEPVVLREVRISDRDVGERLAARIGHIRGDGQKLLEEKKRAKGRTDSFA